MIDPTTYRTMSGYFTTELDSMERLMLIDRPAQKIDIFMQHPTDKVTHLMAFKKTNKQTSDVGHWLEPKKIAQLLMSSVILRDLKQVRLLAF